jgi:hypothetical protein
MEVDAGFEVAPIAESADRIFDQFVFEVDTLAGGVGWCTSNKDCIFKTLVNEICIGWHTQLDISHEEMPCVINRYCKVGGCTRNNIITN